MQQKVTKYDAKGSLRSTKKNRRFSHRYDNETVGSNQYDISGAGYEEYCQKISVSTHYWYTSVYLRELTSGGDIKIRIREPDAPYDEAYVVEIDEPTLLSEPDWVDSYGTLLSTPLVGDYWFCIYCDNGNSSTDYYKGYGDNDITDSGLKITDGTEIWTGHNDLMIRVKSRFYRPDITLDYPVGGELEYQDLTATATATDDDGAVVTVDFYHYDGSTTVQFGSDLNDGDNSYSAILDTTQLTDGQYKIEAVAVDDTGDQTTVSSDWLTIDNHIEPTVEITYPAGGEEISCWDSVEATASDTDGYVDYIDFFLTGCTNRYLGTDTSDSDGWGVDYDSSAAVPDSAQNCQIEAYAYDDTGLEGSDTSEGFFSIDNDFADLSILPSDISFPTPVESASDIYGDEVDLSLTIHNLGGNDVTNVTVNFYRGSVVDDTKEITDPIRNITIPGCSEVTITAKWRRRPPTYDKITAKVSAGDQDNNMTNNTATSAINCKICEENQIVKNGECTNAKLVLAFIPVHWQDTMDDFDSEVDKHADFFKDVYPIKDCQDLVKVVKIYKSCGVWVGSGGNCDNADSIKDCIDKAFTHYTYGIGLEDDDILTSWIGFSCGTGVVYVEKGSDGKSYPVVTSHEIGHEYGLSDEYCDCHPDNGCEADANGDGYDDVMCGPYPGEIINYLTTDYYCDANEPCSGSSDCKWQDYDDMACCWNNGTYTVTCCGNKVDPGISNARAIMSYARAPGPRDFDDLSYAHLDNQSQLDCSVPGEGSAIINVEFVIDTDYNIMPTNLQFASGLTRIPQIPGNFIVRVWDPSHSYIIFEAPFGIWFFIRAEPIEMVDSIPVVLRLPHIEYGPQIIEISDVNDQQIETVLFSQMVNDCDFNMACDPTETFVSCPSDCPSGGPDDYCDRMLDQVCDPDCEDGVDPDCPLINDMDSDGIRDELDNCPEVANGDQTNSDTDGLGDACDICPYDEDPNQYDIDVDTVGDVCDNCPFTTNIDQQDSDSDDIGDVCDKCAGPCPCSAANLDGLNPVNYLDFSIISNDWHQAGAALAGDVDGSQHVNIQDLSIVGEHWLTECVPEPNIVFEDNFNDGDISDWTVTTTGDAVFGVSAAQKVSFPFGVHMASTGNYKAMAVSPSYNLNLDADYNVSLYLRLPHTNNHWFEVFNNHQTYLVIDGSTDLKCYLGNFQSQMIKTLNTDQWYKVEIRTDQVSSTYDVYVDDQYEETCDMWVHTGFEDSFRIGDRADGSADRGEAYWDDFLITQ